MKKVLELDKDNFWGNFNLSLFKMLHGEYLEGLEGFEKRNKDQYLKKLWGISIY